MTDQDNKKQDFSELLEADKVNAPEVGAIVKGKVIFSSKSEIKLDIDGVMVGVVRGTELYREADEYANLKEGDEVEATVIDLENEFGELELSFSYAGHQKAWAALTKAFEDRGIISIKIKEANKGGLICSYGQIAGFLPVSQLSPENYPRVSGGDKGKILDKLRSFIGKDVEVKVIDLSEKEEKLIVSEKEAWSERQKDVISKYEAGTIVEGTVTAITNFGAFITFSDNLEGLIHISELAWQRIENPADIVQVGDKIKAEIINVDGAKIFLSAKKLIDDPWKNVGENYKINNKVKGKVLKVNPFGLFVQLDDDIHALAHISSLNVKAGEQLTDKYKIGEDYDFYIISMEPRKHRLGLGVSKIEAKEDVPSSDIKAAKEKKVEDNKKEESGIMPPSAEATEDKNQELGDKKPVEDKEKKEKSKKEEVKEKEENKK